MSRQLTNKANGTNGAMTHTLTDISKEGRKQFGKLKVQKGSLVWHSGSQKAKNRYSISWEEFDAYMKGRR